MNKIIKKKLNHMCEYTHNDIFIHNEIDTIKKLKEGYSISRFGDSELFMLTGTGNIFYETYEKEMNDYLIEILNNNNGETKLLIGIPPICIKKDPNIKFAGIQEYWKRWVRYKKMNQYINFLKNNTFYSSFFTQLYAYEKNYVAQIVHEILDLWKSKNVVLFLNQQVKNKCTDAINLLFKNVLSIKFEYVPPKNAWINKNDILNKIKSYDTGHLILICCGITATIMAYLATKDGYQIIDFGQFIECIMMKHMDLL